MNWDGLEILRLREALEKITRQLDAVATQRDEAVAGCAGLIVEQSNAEDERDEARVERDIAVADLNDAQADRDKAQKERDEAKKWVEDYIQFWEKAAQDRDAARAERDTLSRDVTLAQQLRNDAIKERDALKASRPMGLGVNLKRPTGRIEALEIKGKEHDHRLDVHINQIKSLEIRVAKLENPNYPYGAR